MNPFLCLCEVTRALQWHDSLCLSKVTPKAMQSILEASGWKQGSTDYRLVDKKMLPIITEFTKGHPLNPEIILVPQQQDFKDYYYRVIEWATILSEHDRSKSSAELITEALLMMENQTIDSAL